MSSESYSVKKTLQLEAAVDQAITARGGDLRATIGANNFLETEVEELMKAVSHAYVRGRFQTYTV
jgi:hypothetical protein